MYSHNYSLSLAQQLPLGLTGVVTYNGSQGRNLFSRTYYNTVDPVTLTRQLPAFAEIDTKENRGIIYSGDCLQSQTELKATHYIWLTKSATQTHRVLCNASLIAPIQLGAP